MAYAAAVVRTSISLSGRQAWVLTITETGVTGATDEWSAEVPLLGTLRLHTCILTQGNGTGTTIDPIVQEATGTATVYNVMTNGTAAATTRNNSLVAHYYVANGTIFGRSTCNGSTGTTGNIVTMLVVEAALET